MDTSSVAGPRAGSAQSDAVDSKLIIAVPFYRNEHLVDPFLDSLIACASEINELGARVLLFNDSPDYPALSEALSRSAGKAAHDFDVMVRTNRANLGWLKTCNLAMQDAHGAGANLVLFNSDTVVTPGALREMVRVSRLDPMIGFVNPRSNNATLATLPIGLAPATKLEDAMARFRLASKTMPDLTYVPTAVGFAVLIRNVILSEFGYFDEVYGGGYNEENDLVMRAGRCGYRAVLANHAYVWHQGEASLGATSSSAARMELPNRRKLISRYPEYPRLVNAWFASPEYMAEQLVSALVPGADGRLTVALDFSDFRNFHSGTYKAGMQFLQHADVWKTKFNVVALCSERAYAFHEMGKTGVARADPDGPERYAAIFRIGQPFDWESVRRMSVKGAVIGTQMLDTIALDCSHLHDPAIHDLWQHVIDHSDFIAYNSAFTARQFGARFANTDRRASVVSLHSTSAEDYPPGDGVPSEKIGRLGDGYILVIGNQYPHKAVGDTANRIAQAYPERAVVALGVTRDRGDIQGAPRGEAAPLGPQNARLADLPNLSGLNAGQLSEIDITALYRKASVIVMPSHYEGFGLPILTALFLQKPMLARRTPPAVEIQQKLNNNPNLHLVDSTAELVKALQTLPAWQDVPQSAYPRADGDRMATQILDVIDRCISQATYAGIRQRVRATQTAASVSSRGMLTTPVDHVNDAESAAYRLGRATEKAAAPLLRIPIVYNALKLAYRLTRSGKPRP